MIHSKLIQPKSIVVVGGSDNPHSPGGKILENLQQNNYKGKIYVVNPKKEQVKDFITFRDVRQLPQVDTAIIAIAAKYVEETVKILSEEKETRGFIIISAGFSDTGAEGKALEKRIVQQIERFGGSLLGPNNIGLINQHYAGVFTTPVPQLDPKGIDLISGSGATAVFIIEAAMQMGLTFNSVWSVGNSAQIGIEEVLAYLDKNHSNNSPKIKMLYIESIQNPKKFLKHSQSLIQKGCHIVAIKAGSSEAGSRAAGSHTGALSSSDLAVDALFDKAGIIRAYGRNELINLAAVLQYGLPTGKNMAIVTHAGGPGVMLTDVLEKNGIRVPEIKGDKAEKLKTELFPGSSIANPIDFLATGTAEHLDKILTTVENDFEQIDAAAVIFGSPGLFQVYDVYDVLMRHIRQNKKPVYPILPSVINVAEEISYFHQQGFAGFPDEVNFGDAFAKAYHQINQTIITDNINTIKPASLVELPAENTYLTVEKSQELLQSFDLPVVAEAVFTKIDDALDFAQKHFPVVLKVSGILHKSDVGGVRLNINNITDFKRHFNELLQIPGATGIIVQAQKQGTELFVGVKKEKDFGHLILFGTGGIYIEVLKDFQTLLAPVSKNEIRKKLSRLKLYPLLKGIRGQKGINLEKFVDLISKISAMVSYYPQITELDLNPVLANQDEIIIVDNRIKIQAE
jgi:acetyltransferase